MKKIEIGLGRLLDEMESSPQPNLLSPGWYCRSGRKAAVPDFLKTLAAWRWTRRENIYVGECSGGRVQVFDARGEFVTQWMVDPEMPLRGLSVDREGVVYVESFAG